MVQAGMLWLGSHQKTCIDGPRAWKPQFSPTHSGRSFAQRKRFRMTVIESVVRGRSLPGPNRLSTPTRKMHDQKPLIVQLL